MPVDISLSEHRVVTKGREYVYWRAQWTNAVGRRVSKRVGRANGKGKISKAEAKRRVLEFAKQLIDRPALREGPTGRSGGRVVTLERFQSDYFLTRPKMNASTKAGMEETFGLLKKFYGGGKRVDEINREEALRWEAWLAEGRAVATVRRHVRTAKSIFGARKHGAVGRGFVQENPFGLLDSASVEGPVVYVTEEVAERVIEALPHWSLRNAFALARYCGLRCPSEMRGMVWDDVKWDRRRIEVHDVKRSRVESAKSVERTPLLDPRAEKWLLKGWDSCPERVNLVCPKLPSKSNLARAVHEAIKEAKVPRWINLWKSLRQSAENDWARAGHPQAVVSRWIGHDIKVSARHYLTVLESDYADKAGGAPATPESPARENAG